MITIMVQIEESEGPDIRAKIVVNEPEDATELEVLFAKYHVAGMTMGSRQFYARGNCGAYHENINIDREGKR